MPRPAARVGRLFGQRVRHAPYRPALRIAAALTLGVGAGFAQPRTPDPSAPASSLRGTPRPEPLPLERGVGRGPSQNASDAGPLGEPTPAACAALGGRWFHIKIAGLSPAPPPADPGIAAPLETPTTDFAVKTPGVAYRGRCAVEQPGSPRSGRGGPDR